MMNRYRWIAYAGAAVLAWTAGEMMVHDLEALYAVRWGRDVVVAFPRWGSWLIRIGTVLLCMTTKWWWPGSPGGTLAGTLPGSTSEAEDSSQRPLQRVHD